MPTFSLQLLPPIALVTIFFQPKVKTGSLVIWNKLQKNAGPVLIGPLSSCIVPDHLEQALFMLFSASLLRAGLASLCVKSISQAGALSKPFTQRPQRFLENVTLTSLTILKNSPQNLKHWKKKLFSSFFFLLKIRCPWDTPLGRISHSSISGLS